MYKTISIQNNTYQYLQMLATKFAKPKSQVIDDLVKQQVEIMKEEEKEKLKEFNAFVADLAAQVKLPKGTKVNTDDIDKDFPALADTDYMP